MDILLLNLANMVNEKGKDKDYSIKQSAVPPLGLLYLAQVLHDNGYDVKVYDQTVITLRNPDLMELIKEMDPKIIGFSIIVDNLYTTVDLLDRIKKWNPNIITVGGNYFGTFYPEKLMKEMDLDFCIRGEGEYILLNLVDKIYKNKENYNDIKGITYRKNGIIKSTPPAEKIKDLDELPFPNRKLIDFNYKLFHKSTSILTSRGCPFQCRFCFFSLLQGKKWRSRSAKNIVEELKMLKDQGYKEILFVDDNFTLNLKRIYRICAEIKKNKLDDLEYSCDSRIDNASLTLFRALSSINCKKITFGIESGVQRILDYYNKRIKISQVKNAIKNAKKARMEILYGSFVLGAPNETIDDIKKTIKFANNLGLSFMVYEILETIPISPIYKECVDKGWHEPRDDDWKRIVLVPDICPTAVNTKLLTKFIQNAMIKFISSKKRNINLVFESLKSNYYIEGIINSVKNFKIGDLQKNE
ncbi:MAG: radical SAM protein [Candidatus Lokiarchaeota archaeon]|nr:radical SAM protein [Candidatus Lokiarchaeota archaeon]